MRQRRREPSIAQTHPGFEEVIHTVFVLNNGVVGVTAPLAQ